MKKITSYGDFPEGLAQPALRALVAAGIKNLKDLAAYTESDFSNLHGIGPKAVTVLKTTLKEKGLSFRKK